MSDWNEHEPMPVVNDFANVMDKVIQAMQERKEKGKERYGVYLQPFNGRRVIIDLAQELMDATNYAFQANTEFEFYYHLLDATGEYFLTGKTEKLDAMRDTILKVRKLMDNLYEKEKDNAKAE